MTHTSQDIIGIVKELEGKKCSQNQQWHDCCEVCGRTQELFPAIAQALLIAMDTIKTISEGESDNDGFRFTKAQGIAEEALSQIKSLPFTK